MENNSRNLELEKSLLGGVMHWPKELDEYGVSPEDFYSPKHEEIFRVMVNEINAGNPADPVTLASKLTDVKGADFAYLYELFEKAPGSRVNVMRQAEAIAGLAHKRSLEATLREFYAEVVELPWSKLDEPLDRLRASLDKSAEQVANVEVAEFADLFMEAASMWSEPANKDVVGTGWQSLDDYLNGGLRPGQLTILGARPATGKSAIASCIAVANHTKGVGVFSLEMPAHEFINRMASIETGIELSRFTKHELRDYDWDKVSKFQRKLPEWKVVIEDRPQRSIAQMRASLRTWRRKHDIKVVIVDYLQLMAPADRNEMRERQVSRMAEDLKAMAKDFNVAVLALAQVNRGSTMSENKRPTMSHLRESGSLEANADQVLLLHRDDDKPHALEIIVAKNRHGSTGTVELIWSGAVSSAYEEERGHASYPFGTGISLEG